MNEKFLRQYNLKCAKTLEYFFKYYMNDKEIVEQALKDMRYI